MAVNLTKRRQRDCQLPCVTDQASHSNGEIPASAFYKLKYRPTPVDEPLPSRLMMLLFPCGRRRKTKGAIAVGTNVSPGGWVLGERSPIHCSWW